MIFEQFKAGGCRSYLIGCEETCAAVLVDPESSLIDRYVTTAARDGLRIHYVVDTHTHADHFSAALQLSRQLGVPLAMHRASPAAFVDLRLDDGDMLIVGKLRVQVLYTPGHTVDSICLHAGEHLLTGDTLLMGATGRTDLPTGDPNALYDSLFNGILKLDPALQIHPAHEYHGRGGSSIGEEIENNPRLKTRDRTEFIAMMRNLNLGMPTHITEALRTNMNGGKPVAQMLEEAAAAVPFMSIEQLHSRLERGNTDLIVLDVRERDAYEKGHIARARLLPRGQLELCVDEALPDPTRRIVVYCEFGRISTLAVATLRTMGYIRTSALDGGLQAWTQAGFALEAGAQR